jgi:flagellar motor protein MotB
MSIRTRSPRRAATTGLPESYMGSVGDLLAGLLFVCLLLAAAGPLTRHEAVPAPVVAATPVPFVADPPKPVAAKPVAAKPVAKPAVVPTPVEVPTAPPAEVGLPALPSEARGQALQEIQRELAGRGVIVRVDPRLGVLRLPEELLFDPGRAAMRPDAAARLERLAAAMLYFLPHLPQLESVLVEGHTDDRPIRGTLTDAAGVHADNWDLAYHRAKATYQGLVQAAPALGRLMNDRGEPVLGMGAYGPARPVATNATADGRRQNRRIDLRVVLAPDRPITPARPEAK